MSQMQDPFPQQQRMSKSHKMLLQPQPFPQPHPPAPAPSKKFIVCTSCFGFLIHSYAVFSKCVSLYPIKKGNKNRYDNGY